MGRKTRFFGALVLLFALDIILRLLHSTITVVGTGGEFLFLAWLMTWLTDRDGKQ